MKRILILSLFLATFGLSSMVVQADTTYYRVLADQKTTTWADASRVITIFKGRENQLTEYASQMSYLVQEGVVDANHQPSAETTLRKGDLAKLVFRALRLKGGVMTHVLKPWMGDTKRYSLKECIYLGIMQPAPDSGLVSGTELISVLKRMTEYQEGQLS